MVGKIKAPIYIRKSFRNKYIYITYVFIGFEGLRFIKIQSLANPFNGSDEKNDLFYVIR